MSHRREIDLPYLADPIDPGSGNGGLQLFDDLVGTSEKRLGNGDTQRPGRLEVDDQLEFSRLLDGKIRRPGTLEN
jgi:hypothetical protein